MKSEAVTLKVRQAQCLSLVAKGLSSSAIGSQLGISLRTVDQHVEGARAVLEAQTRGEAVEKARALGLI
ncbi:response regulator transcription factor [Caulobacter sp. RHG1]|uniref:response regulator transcription factor n=1 Tax=Caulobacter sp. (strain RHG1) TaxID=2545762 RepID=UPI001554D4D4|nr:helix-turn-helix transcriptional regulator [Caulobacter sp. RHG1]NQE61652.1 hypothetical protein [Caulobacter sp. RHG1]